MTDDIHTVFGVPIDGVIIRGGRHSKTQRPFADLTSYVSDVFADTFFDSFGWTQYTPFFDDGELCVFGTHNFWIRTVDDVAHDEREAMKMNITLCGDPTIDTLKFDYLMDERYGLEYAHPTLGALDRNRRWDAKIREYVYGEETYTGPDRERFDRAYRLYEAIVGGAFDDALMRTFGEHARIIVTREAVYIREYMHY